MGNEKNEELEALMQDFLGGKQPVSDKDLMEANRAAARVAHERTDGFSVCIYGRECYLLGKEAGRREAFLSIRKNASQEK